MKTVYLSALLFIAAVTSAQLTYPFPIPDTIPNYDGSYDHFGQGELYYPNGGEVRFTDEDQTDAIDYVRYYTMNTYPKRYLLHNNNLSLCHSKKSTVSGTPDSLHRIDLEWFRSEPTAFLARVDTQQTGVLNYFTPRFGPGGRTNVQGGAAIVCQSIYPNIDMVYLSNNAGVVIYFIVYPGGNYSDIRMHIAGSKANAIVGNKLKIESNWDHMTFEKPQMYQYTIVNNVVTPVTVCNASWQSMGSGSDMYQVYTPDPYNTGLPLIIQLKQGHAVQANAVGLGWSTYFGGNQSDRLNRAHSDANNNLYAAGYSNSTSLFPQGPGVVPIIADQGDGVIVKFNNIGKLQWSTFVGGSSPDEIRDFAFSGNSVYCVGRTGSNDLAVKNKSGATNNSTFSGGVWDGFIFEFEFNPVNSTFQKNWLTYFGGNGMEELHACKFDSQGDLFVVGESASTNMTPMGPMGTYQVNFNSAQLNSLQPLSTDGIIVKFDASSLQNWFTFYGTDQLGTNASAYAADYLYGIDIEGTDVYVCGKSGGSNLPNSINAKQNSGNFDGILVRFTTAGGMTAGDAKFTDGNISNYGVKVHWDKVYLAGQGDGAMSPVNSGQFYYNGTASGNTDGCFSVHSRDLATTIHNTFLGGDGDDAAYDIQYTSNNLFYVAGGTKSTDFPSNSLTGMYAGTGGPDPLTSGWTDNNFVSCFEMGSASLPWSTYLGSEDFHESSIFPKGVDFQQELGITSIAVDGMDRLHLTGYSNSYNTFPLKDNTQIPYFQPTKKGGGNDATVTRFDLSTMNAIVGLEDFQNTEFVFGLYPNPASSDLFITNKAIAGGALHYAVYDLNGRKLKEGAFKADESKTIDVSVLPQGVYVINASNGKTTISNKFVKTGD